MNLFLKPCKNCGGEKIEKSEENNQYAFKCKDCGYQTEFKDKAFECAAEWNESVVDQ